MRTHYDLLGVRSDADDEALRKAYHKAAKANHPDLNADDPEAPRRFGQIATAIEILRHPQQRAAYDRSLDRQRQQRRLRRARIIIVVANAIAAAVLIVVLAGGHAPIGPTPLTSTMASKAENNGVPRRAVIAGERGLQRTDSTGDDEPRHTPEQGLPAGQQLEAAERAVTPRREQDEHAAAFEPQTAEHEAAPRRERDERRQERKTRRLAAIAEAAKSGTSASSTSTFAAPTLSRAIQTTQTASSAASPRSFGPVEIAATRAFARF